VSIRREDGRRDRENRSLIEREIAGALLHQLSATEQSI
jgi:hypothetical protein